MVFEKSGQSLLVLQASPERLHFFGGTGAVSATQPHVLHSGAVPVAPNLFRVLTERRGVVTPSSTPHRAAWWISSTPKNRTSC